MFLNFGVSGIFRDLSNSSEVASVVLNGVLRVDPNAETFDVDATDWLNLAWEIAKEGKILNFFPNLSWLYPLI